jgi:hypothetical protein
MRAGPMAVGVNAETTVMLLACEQMGYPALSAPLGGHPPSVVHSERDDSSSAERLARQRGGAIRSRRGFDVGAVSRLGDISPLLGDMGPFVAPLARS